MRSLVGDLDQAGVALRLAAHAAAPATAEHQHLAALPSRAGRRTAAGGGEVPAHGCWSRTRATVSGSDDFSRSRIVRTLFFASLTSMLCTRPSLGARALTSAAAQRPLQFPAPHRPAEQPEREVGLGGDGLGVERDAILPVRGQQGGRLGALPHRRRRRRFRACRAARVAPGAGWFSAPAATRQVGHLARTSRACEAVPVPRSSRRRAAGRGRSRGARRRGGAGRRGAARPSTASPRLNSTSTGASPCRPPGW